jgi:hypothetical protein
MSGIFGEIAVLAGDAGEALADLPDEQDEGKGIGIPAQCHY